MVVIATVTRLIKGKNIFLADASDHSPPNRHVIHISKVVQGELDELLVLLLSDVLDEAGRFELFTELECGQTIFGESKVEFVDDCVFKGRRKRGKEMRHGC